MRRVLLDESVESALVDAAFLGERLVLQSHLLDRGSQRLDLRLFLSVRVINQMLSI